MRVKFWGVRGSLGTPQLNSQTRQKLRDVLELGVEYGLDSVDKIPDFLKTLPWHLDNTAGGDTTCVEVNAGGENIIFDCGTGIRPLGMELMSRYQGETFSANILITHTHWDHICGLPFFTPAFNPGNDIKIFGMHDRLKHRLEGQQKYDYFPVPLSIMSGIKDIQELPEESSFNVGDVNVETILLNHPGKCFGYRLNFDGKSMVFVTDSEYKSIYSKNLKPYHDFFQGADLVVFDAQYTFLENIEKEDWGHSTAFIGIDMALDFGVKRLALTHHEPSYDDEKLYSIFQQAEKYLHIHAKGRKLELILAQEGEIVEF